MDVDQTRMVRPNHLVVVIEVRLSQAVERVEAAVGRPVCSRVMPQIPLDRERARGVSG